MLAPVRAGKPLQNDDSVQRWSRRNFEVRRPLPARRQYEQPDVGSDVGDGGVTPSYNASANCWGHRSRLSDSVRIWKWRCSPSNCR